MSRIRFTVGQLMAIVLFLAFCFGSLRNAGPALASTVYTLAIVAIVVGLVGTLVISGTARGRGWASPPPDGRFSLSATCRPGNTAGSGSDRYPNHYCYSSGARRPFSRISSRSLQALSPKLPSIC